MISNIIQLARPHQYVKNIFVFAPVFFSGMLLDLSALVNTLAAFFIFSIAASGIYILNDLKDVKEDREHPTKKNRPIANGSVPIGFAWLLSISLGVLALVLAYLESIMLLSVISTYILLNIAYSLGLKHIPIVDISIISTGFVLRIFAGSAAINLAPSMWIILMTYILALFLALAKRRDDVLLSSQGLNTRKNIDGYNLEFVNAAMVIMSSVIIVAYIFYTISAEVQERLQTEYLYLTVIFVIIGIMRYMQITFVENNSGSPTKILLKDHFLQITVSIWAAAFGAIIYSNGII